MTDSNKYIYNFYRNLNPVLSSKLISGTKVTRWMPHGEQELPTIPEHLCLPPVFVGLVLRDL